MQFQNAFKNQNLLEKFIMHYFALGKELLRNWLNFLKLNITKINKLNNNNKKINQSIGEHIWYRKQRIFTLKIKMPCSRFPCRSILEKELKFGLGLKNLFCFYPLPSLFYPLTRYLRCVNYLIIYMK